MAGWWREYVSKDFGRSSHWRKTRKIHISSNSICVVCNSSKKLQVHHIIPFAVDPSKELDPTNLITFCSRCHLLIGHGGSWRCYVPDLLRVVYIVRLHVYNMRIKI